MLGRVVSTLAVLSLALISPVARAFTLEADVAIHADGTRETVADPRKDSKGQWMATIEGRRVALHPGDVVALVDAKGKEIETIPELSGAPKSPADEAALKQLSDPKNEAWIMAAEQLGAAGSRAVMDELVALTKDGKKELRGRAIAALVRLRTKESSLAAAKAVLAEKDANVRRESASALFAAWEILRRSDSAEVIASGLADKDPMLRIVFATLARRDDAAATEILRKEGLKSADHHVRESSALELALRGDASGESVLVAMLQRDRIPGLHDEDPALVERMVVREKVQVCEALGKVGTDSARAALRKATSSPHEAVRKAAEAALGPA